MNRESRHEREIEKLHRERQHFNERLEKQRERKISGSLSDKQEHIIAVALTLLDEEGLENVTLRKLAQKLGIQAPAIYWHFKNKTALIDYMAEAILRSEFKNLQVRKGDEAWQDWLMSACQRLRKAMSTHRDGARVVAGAHLFPAVTLLELFETSQESLTSAGVEVRKADLIVSTAVHFTFGRVIEEQSSPTPEDLEKIDVSAFLKNYPHIFKSIQRAREDMKSGYDEFDDALRLIIGYPDTAK